MKYTALVAIALMFAASIRADGPKDNLPDAVRRIPPPGIKLADNDRAELQEGADALSKAIETLRGKLKDQPALLELLPDVEVFHKAVAWALKYDEFFNPKEVPVARELLKVGNERVDALAAGKTPWTTATGPVVRGYRSRIDGSVQPYGLVVPVSYQPGGTTRFRLDSWFHGRGEVLSELSFINGRLRSLGEFAPANAFVLHPYGRYCNANKFAGETDWFEALDHAKRHYPIDPDRICVRGFSMGGAACWQFAVHYAGQWAAAAPGAGFAETAEFLNVFQNEKVEPAWYEKKLWHMYDCTDYAINLFNCPTVAYSGEIDRQKQAADVMAKAMKAEGLDLVHIIGPNTGHSFHPQAKEEINRRIDALVQRGRNPVPRQVKFTTWTLRYPEMLWIRVEGLEEHWKRARVEAEITGANSVDVKTENVSHLTLKMPPGLCPLDAARRPKVRLDGKDLEAPAPGADRSWLAHFHKANGQWVAGETATSDQLRKRPGLQGPIDDAFMDSFLMVRPTGKPLNDAVGKWAQAEMAHAVEHWRRQFRGDARIKNDTDVSEADIANHNLVIWGDPASNRLLARIADRLPLRWDGQTLDLGKDRKYDAAHHVPVLIYPNPLNPRRYVVLNSSFTYREYDYLNNARQVSKLPDFAVIDIRVPVSSRSPGGIATAGFFNERWDLPMGTPK